MSDNARTGTFVAIAAVLGLSALFAVPKPAAPEAFSDVGQQFYPEFTDPLKAASLEVVESKAGTSEPKIFKVNQEYGRWIIPSHHKYPADAKKRLAETAANLIGLQRDQIRTDRTQDHEQCGVIDPLDQTVTTTQGRGRRVTLRDASEKVLVDLIFGLETREGSGMRYVRIPGQKRVYAVKTKADISAKFEDWIETDLLLFTPASLRRITIDDYTVDEDKGNIVRKGTYDLTRDDSAAPWKLNELPDTEEINTGTVNDLVTAVDELKIVGVRRKSEGIISLLTGKTDKLTAQDRVRLQSCGYFITRDGGLVSNEGDVSIRCDDGVIYTLRFGEVVYGMGDYISSGDTKDPKKDPKKKEGDESEHRYLFVTAQFNESFFGDAPAAPKPKSIDPALTDEQKKAEEERFTKEQREYETKKQEREQKIASGKKRTDDLTKRFADWYYVISADYFKKLRKTRADLVKAKETPKQDEPPKKEEPHKHD